MLRTSTSSSSSSQVILQIKSIEKPLKITRVFLSSPLLQLGWSSLQLLGAARSSWRRKMTIRIHQRIWWLPDVHRFPTKPCWKKVGDRSSPTVFHATRHWKWSVVTPTLQRTDQSPMGPMHYWDVSGLFVNWGPLLRCIQCIHDSED